MQENTRERCAPDRETIPIANKPFNHCVTCHCIDFLINRKLDKNQVCSTCIRVKGINKFSAENGMIPDRVPPELADLSLLEEMLISKIIPHIHIARLRHGGQLVYKNHTIAFPQDVLTLVKDLPRAPSQTPILVIRKEGVENTHRDYRVRRDSVYRALTWLQKNNKYFSDINIVCEKVQQLPIDGIPSDLPTSLQDLNDEDMNLHSDGIDVVDSDFTAVQTLGSNSTEKDKIQSIINDHIPWPKADKNPVNEFSEPGFYTKSYPTLFPCGTADYTHIDESNQRPKSLHLAEWLKHLLAYKDGRYARHPRFRYHAFNILQRQRANESGRIYVKMNARSTKMTAEELKSILNKNDKQIAKSLYHFSSTIRGTPQWKYSKKNELLDMIQFNGLPTFFMTMSAADLHWPDLQYMMKLHEQGDEIYECSIDDRGRSQRIVNNPHFVSAFFVRRVNNFLKDVVNSDNQLKEWWVIYEWQHRGSVHAHMLLWMRNCPFKDVEDVVKNGNEDQKNLLTEYYDEYISACNPSCISVLDIKKLKDIDPNNTELGNPVRVPPKTDIHPCRIKFEDVENVEEDLAILVNSVQIHRTCSVQTCLRSQPDQDPVCKNGFPKDLSEVSTFVEDPKHKGEYIFVPARNDPYVNNYPKKCWLQIQRSNMDIQACLSYHSLANYLTKYLTKDEPFSDALKDITERVSSAESLRIPSSEDVFRRALIRTVGCRDYSAQEVVHHGLQLPAYSSSQSGVVISLDQRQYDAMKKQTSKSAWQKYVERSPEHHHLSLYNYAQDYNLENHKKRSKSVFLRVYPRYNVSNSGSEHFEEFCIQQLMLHKPAVSLSELKDTNEQSATDALCSWIESGGYVPPKVRHIVSSGRSQEVLLSTCSSDTSSVAIQPLHEDDDWILAGEPRQLPQSTPPSHFDWSIYWQSIPVLALDASSFHNEKQKQESDFVAEVHPDNLNAQQKKAYETILKSLNNNEEPLRLIVSGTAGSGKSYLINCVRNYIHQYLEPSFLNVCAPTGTAAFNIKGETIHRLLCLPVPLGTTTLLDLKGERLLAFQEAMKNLKLLLIDEMSMIGRRMLRCIDLRLRQINPSRSSLAFGGINICLFGDFGQLPPVLDKPMFVDDYAGPTSLSWGGKIAFETFNKAVVLTTVERVKGDDQSQMQFRQILANIRNGCVTESDHKILMTRLKCNLLEAEISHFDNAPRLVPDHRSETIINDRFLKMLNEPICKIHAVHHPPAAIKADAQNAWGLEPCISLAIGATVMLRSNINVNAGLTNGTIGTVHGILYDPVSSGPPTLPVAVCVCFPQYEGKVWDVNNPKVVPILPVRATWTDGGKIHSRTQIPLSLAFATTIHKAQGWTKPYIVLDIGKTEFTSGISFVAFSRVKSLSGIMLDPLDINNVQFSRFLSINSAKGINRVKLIDSYISKLESRT